MAEMIDDSSRLLRLTSPLGGDLAIKSFQGTEEVGRLFQYQLELISHNPDIKFEDIVGQRVTITLHLQSGERYFDGFVTEFHYQGHDDTFSHYHATVRPWLWFLTRTSDCRIFQGQKVPDIIKEVIRDNGLLSDVNDQLSSTYRDWIYCVQYRETDFNFLSRLMEQEGMFFFFKHEEGKHTLELVDDMNALQPFPDFDSVPYTSVSGGTRMEREDYLDRVSTVQAVQPGKYAISDFDFEKPRVELMSKLTRERPHAYEISDPEIYDYPGEFMEQGDGDDYVERRLQELQSQHERTRVSGECRFLAPGHVISLVDHPREDQNKEYLVVSASYSIDNGSFRTSEDGGPTYHCHAELADKEEVFRMARVTPKPVVQGCQTAVVVGPESEEIHCDEYGRVKVHFHWDRHHEREDEASSCWMRVSQAWAGKEWGSMHIPRIGQEVIVSFLEGDPDQPIITGRVFNGENMPIWGLPGSKTQSGIKSRSTPGGGPSNYNEVRMEDQKGSELLSIQAEKNEKILVKNDKTETVGHDEKIDIGNDRTENVGHDETRTVGNDETVTIGNNRMDTVMMDETRVVNNNRSRTVAKNETVMVNLTRTHTVGVNEAITVGGAQEITVGGIQEISVGGMQETSVGASREVSVAGSQSEEIGRALNTDVGKDWAISVGDDCAVKVGKKVKIDAGDELTLQCGSAKIVMKKNGNITINGMKIVQKAKSKIDIKASGTVKIKGAQVKDN